jgi:phosphatidylserine decarboxylase
VFAPGGARFIAPAGAALAAVAVAVGLRWLLLGPAVAALGTVLAALLLFLAIFFRDPERRPGAGIVSAADGRVRAVERRGGAWLVSVFMNVTDVHVNRFPLDGTVESMERGGVGAAPAYRPGAESNVHLRYRLSTALGPVEVVQITGAVARRLVPFVRPGDARAKGDRLGMIVLGSRVDLLLPADRVRPTVAVGDRVRAGASTVAEVAP